MAVSSISSRLAHKLKPLLQDQQWVPLHLSLDEEKELFTVLERKGARTPLGRAITLYRLSHDVKFYLDALEKFLRIPTASHGVVIEERVWHGASPLELERHVALKGLDDLFARVEGRVSHIKEGDRTRVVLHNASLTISKIAVTIDWATGPEETMSQLWLERFHGFSDAESFWWLYFDHHQIGSYVAQTGDVELILW